MILGCGDGSAGSIYRARCRFKFPGPYKIAHTYNSISGTGWRQRYPGDLPKRSAPDSIKDLVSKNTEPGSGGWLRSLIPALSEFKDKLVHRVSSRAARAYTERPCVTKANT